MDSYYYTVFFTEFLAAISATVFLYKYKHTQLIWLLPILWFIPTNELVCQYIFPREPMGYALYNVYRILVPISIMGLVLSQLKSRYSQKMTKALVAIAIILFIIELVTINPLISFLDFSFTASSIIIIVILLIYFVEELNGNHHSNVKHNLFLWVCFGFLVFHLTYPIVLFAQKYIKNESEQFILSLNKVQLMLSIISYSIIAFGFFWGDKIKISEKVK